MESVFPGKPQTIDNGLRKIILTELIFPVVLLTLGIYHGLLQVLYRAGIIKAQSFLGLEYYQGLTLHGTVNALLFTLYFAVAFGNAYVPYLLGKKISTKTAGISLGMILLGTIMSAAAILTGKASVLFTFYAPLVAAPIFYIGLVLIVLGSWLSFFNWIPAYKAYRKENKKAPLGVVLLFTAFIVWIIATVPVAIEILFQLLPLSMGWTSSINVALSRLLFWFFGHPLVYFWILPAYAIIYPIFPAVAGGKIYSDFAGRFAAMILLVYSTPVGLHHQFTEPTASAGWKLLHGFFTFFVAIPSLVTAFSIPASLEIGARERGGQGLFRWWGKLPYLDTERWMFGYFFSGLFVFIFGGITGIINASYSMNNMVHNTSWMPAHFHMTVAGPVFLAFIAVTLHMCSTLLGKEVKLKKLNVWVPYAFIFGQCIFSFGGFYGAFSGEPRRTNMGLTYLNPESHLYRPEWHFSTMTAAVGGTIMAIAMIAYFVIFFGTIFGKRVKEPVVRFPIAEPHHDEDVPAVQNFKPWIIGALVALVIAYAVPVYQTMSDNFGSSPAYSPSGPTPLHLENK